MSEEISHGTAPSILDRISEREVCNWMLAKLEQIRATKLPDCHNLCITAFWYDHMSAPETNWGMHASGECVTSEPNFDIALAKLHNEVLVEPEKKALEKKRQAAELLREAASLEALIPK